MSLLSSRATIASEPATSAARVRTWGDVDATVTHSGRTAVHIWTEPLTADRTATLSAFGPPATGARLKIVRSADATGAFDLSVGGLASLDPGEWAEVEWNGAAWTLVQEVPAPANKLTATAIGVNTVRLQWGNPDRLASTVEIHRSLDPDFTPTSGTMVDALAGSATEETDTVG